MLFSRHVLTRISSDSVFYDAFDARMEAGGGRAATLDYHICIKTIVRSSHPFTSSLMEFVVGFCIMPSPFVRTQSRYSDD